MKYTHVNHKSLKPYIPYDPEILILGSFPSVKSREENFYYVNKTNRFYLTLASIFNEEEPKTLDAKNEFLNKHHIALYDVIEECDIFGSKDASIKNVIPASKVINDIKINYPQIVIYTTGKKAYNLYQSFIGNDNIYLPSTSFANASYDITKLIREYRKIILGL